MTIASGWRARFSTLFNDAKGPWGGRGGGDDGSGNGGGGDDGPRNPWQMPPGGRRGKPGPSALDEFLKKARGSGGGGGNPFGSGFPGGSPPKSLWLIGVGLIVAVWLVFTSFHAIGPQERGVVTMLGRYSGTLEPGIRMTLPAPFQSVRKVDVQVIRTEEFPQGGGDNLMITGDQNIVDLAYSVRWDIANPQNYLFEIADPEETVRATAESAMRAAIAEASLDQAIGAGRTIIEGRVQEIMQGILDGYHAGVRVQGIAISKADPPDQVIDDFKAVSAAQQEAVGNLNNARAYAQQIIARAQGEAAQFDKVYEQYKLAPDVTRRRMYYETMEEVLAKTDKTIVEAPGVVPYLPLPGVAEEAGRNHGGDAAMNPLSFRNPITVGIAVLVALIVLASTLVIVPETQQGVILRFEQPVGTVNVYRPDQPFGRTGAGLLAKVPFIDKVVWVDKRGARRRSRQHAIAVDRSVAADGRCLCPFPRHRSAQDGGDRRDRGARRRTAPSAVRVVAAQRTGQAAVRGAAQSRAGQGDG